MRLPVPSPMRQMISIPIPGTTTSPLEIPSMSGGSQTPLLPLPSTSLTITSACGTVDMRGFNRRPLERDC